VGGGLLKVFVLILNKEAGLITKPNFGISSSFLKILVFTKLFFKILFFPKYYFLKFTKSEL